MKTTLIRLAQASILVAVFYLGMVAISSTVYSDNRRLICYFLPYIQRVGGQESLMLADYSAEQPYEAIVLGSSHAYRGYDPRIFEEANIRLFNAGSSSQNTLVSRALTEHILQPSAQQLYLIDVYDKVWSGDGIESCNRLIQNSISHDFSLDLAFYPLDLRKINQYSTWLFSNTTVKEVEAKDYVRLGYCSQQDTLTKAPEALPSPETINPLFEQQLKKTMELLDRAGASYIFVSHPQPVTQGLQTYHAPLKKIVENIAKASNTFYLDYTLDSRFADYGYFADANHLNQRGVDLFNTILIKDLKEKKPELLDRFQTSP
jgi:hypothetical protein